MRLKKCTKCLQTKTAEEFYKIRKDKNWLMPSCKVCSTNLSKPHKKKWQKTKGRLHESHKRKLNMGHIFEYFKTHPCIDCGISDPIVLEFDHKDRNKKDYNISRMTNCSWERILKEIKRCEVRCANCHRIKTGEENGWWKNLSEV